MEQTHQMSNRLHVDEGVWLSKDEEYERATKVHSWRGKHSNSKIYAAVVNVYGELGCVIGFDLYWYGKCTSVYGNAHSFVKLSLEFAELAVKQSPMEFYVM